MPSAIKSVECIDRPTFTRMVAEIEEFLKGKIPILSVLEEYSRLEDLFEEYAIFLPPVVPRKKRVLVPVRLTQSELDQLTLECALICQNYGVSDLRYVEHLNALRDAVIQMLKVLGAEVRGARSDGQNRMAWVKIPLYAKVARREGMSKKELAELRDGV